MLISDDESDSAVEGSINQDHEVVSELESLGTDVPLTDDASSADESCPEPNQSHIRRPKTMMNPPMIIPPSHSLTVIRRFHRRLVVPSVCVRHGALT